MYVIAISCACLLICYYLYREINKTKADITTLKEFSGNVGSFLERASQQPEKVVATREEPVVLKKEVAAREEPVVLQKEPVLTEAKKDD
jgi:hypothetical protein